MKRMSKLLLALIMLLSLTSVAFAAEGESAVASVNGETYTTVQAAVLAANGEVVTLLADSDETVTASGDLYLDLNGKTLAGLTITNGKLYGMDSTTDKYNNPDGCGKIAQFTGVYAAHCRVNMKRYVAVEETSGLSFHRIYLGITKVSLAPASTGIGYKAEFYGDSKALEKISTYGYSLSLGDGAAVTRKTNTFKSPLTLRVQNFDVANYGQTAVNASAMVTLTDGTVIQSTTVSYSMRQMVELVAASFSSFTNEQKESVRSMCQTHEAAMADWDIDPIFATGVFEPGYDETLWDVSGQDEGYVTVIGGGGATAKPLQFAGSYTNIDLTVNARDYADSTTASRTDVEFVFENGQSVTFGLVNEQNIPRIQTRGGTLLNWKSPYDLTQEEADRYLIDAEEIAAGNEDGVDLRIIRYGTTIYLFIENKQVAICDLTKCANSAGDTESGVTADTKMSVYLRHYEDAREDGVEIPFAITTEIEVVDVIDGTVEGGTVTGGKINHYVNNVRVSKYSDTHFANEVVTVTAVPNSGYKVTGISVDGQDVTAQAVDNEDGTFSYSFPATKAEYAASATFEEYFIFEDNYDNALWDLSGQYDGYVTVIGGGGATAKPLQFIGSYQNVDLTLNARDYADSSTKSRTEFGFEFDVDGDGIIDTAKGDQTVTFGIAEGDRIQGRAGTLLSWKSPYDLNATEKAQLIIDADEIAAGNEDGLDLRVIRYGTGIYLFIENKQVAYCDLTKCANSAGDTESGITADTKMFVYLRHYDDLREDGVQIPFSIKTNVKPVVVNDSTAERGAVTGNAVNYYVNNERISKYSDLHFMGEKVTLTARPDKGNRFVSFTVDGKKIDGTTYAFTASKDSYDVCAVFEEIVIFENNYDTALWDLSGQYDGYVTVIGGGGATNKPLQFVGSYQDVDLTLNAKDYADVSTKSRTEFGFEFDVDGDGKIDTTKGDQTVTFGIAEGNKLQTRGGTLLNWKTPYDLNTAEKAQLLIDAEEISAGNEDGLDLRIVRYGTVIYLFVENRQVAICDLTKCANSAGDTESGITADTKMYIYLRHYDDLREAGVQIPFSIKTDVTPVEVSVTAAENGTAHAGYVNYYVNNGRTSKLSDTHFVGEKVTLTATPASEELVCSQMLVNGNDQTGSMTVNTAGAGTYTFTAGAKAYNVAFAFGTPVFENTFNTAVWNVAQQCQGVVALPAGGGGTGYPLQFRGTYTDVDVSLVARDYADQAKTASRTDLEFVFDNGETVTFGVVYDGGSYRIQNRGGTLLSWKTPYFITDKALIDAYVVTAEEMKSGNPGGLNFRVVRYGTEFYLYLNDQMVKGYDFSYKLTADTTVTVYLRHYDDAGVKVEIPFEITGDVTVEDLRLFTEKEPITNHSYSFAVIPDTQIVVENDVVNGETNTAKLFDWIVANQEAKNIQFVFGLGDITDNNNEAEWTLAQAQHQKLMDAGIPYSVVRGNHDLSWYGKEEGAENYTVDDYTKYMGTTAYRAQFGGFHNQNNIANSWRTLQVGDMKYLLITLDYGANDDVLNWASGVIYQHPDHNVIITTHGYLFRDGTTLDEGDIVPPSTSGGVNDGDDMWEKLVSKHENIVLVMSGHDPQENIIVNRSNGDNGNVVTAMLIDAQDAEAQEGSMGMVALLHFSADGKTVQVEYYSTAKEKYFKAENQFSLELNVVEKAQSGTVAATGAYTNVSLSEGSAYTTTITDEQKVTLPETPYTISTWINLSTGVNDAAGVIIGNYSGSFANCLNIEISTNGNPRLYHRNASNVFDSLVFNNVDIRSNTQWVHLVFTISGNRVSCYVNGELKQTLTANNTIHLESTNADFIIGGDFRSGNSRAFKGRILSLDLYSGILSAEKIQSLYENGIDAVTEGKIEY